jgi:succinate dehydrogenase hydrophobic anchor subunit
MRIVAIVCNVLLFVFTSFVLATDGPPEEASYIVFAVWSQLTRIISAVVLFGTGASGGWLGFRRIREALEGQQKTADLSSRDRFMRIVAILFNIVCFGFVCWALVDQYPHPNEAGFIEYVVFMILTPILSVVALFRCQTNRLQATPGARLG